jgi:ribosomal peptide maturation radical SAM protein 1
MTGDADMICLANMPFSPIAYPPLGPQLAAAILKEAGMEVRSFYFNFDFADAIGIEDYFLFLRQDELPLYALDWLFAGTAWGWSAPREEESLSELLNYAEVTRNLPARSSADRLTRIRREVVPSFLDGCVERIRQSRPSVVGFSGMFQVIPALALGRMLREAMPEVKLIYGGAAFHGDIGKELFDKTEWIDAISTSEADDVLAEAFRRLRDGEPLIGLQGMMSRNGGAVCKTAGSFVPAERFDCALVPDFGDFFEAAGEHGLMGYCEANPRLKTLPFETSRGCWWHDKSPCSFCGLNPSGPYRLKSPENVLSVIKSLHDKYGVTRFSATDTNLSMEYFETFMPKFRDMFPDGGVELFFCVKSNMSRAQLKLLAECGVSSLQPGIESLSDHVLRLMRKGVSAIQNVFFLKCAAQYGIFPYWYILMGTPGETAEDCREIASLIPSIRHLTPPGRDDAFVQVHRYSEYWRDCEKFFGGIEPAGWYQAIFPRSYDLAKLAFSFDVKRKDADDVVEARSAVIAETREWIRLWKGEETPCLCLADDGSSVVDSRAEARVKIAFQGAEAEIYGMLDDISAKSSIMERSSAVCSEDETERILESFVGCGLAMRSGDLYLGLALRGGFKKWSLSEKFAFGIKK